MSWKIALLLVGYSFISGVAFATRIFRYTLLDIKRGAKVHPGKIIYLPFLFWSIIWPIAWVVDIIHALIHKPTAEEIAKEIIAGLARKKHTNDESRESPHKDN